MQTYLSNFDLTEGHLLHLNPDQVDELQSLLSAGPEIEPTFSEPVQSAGKEDTYNFRFDIKLIQIRGTISKSGRLEIWVSTFGIELAHQVFEFGGERRIFSFRVGINYLTTLTLTFSFANGCLKSKGDFKVWNRRRAGWDKNIICF